MILRKVYDKHNKDMDVVFSVASRQLFVPVTKIKFDHLFLFSSEVIKTTTELSYIRWM